MLDLMELEIGRHPWDEISCRCGGTAAHVAGNLRRMATATTDAEALDADLGNCLWLAGCLEAAAVPATAVALAALAGGNTTERGRLSLLHLITCATEDDGLGFDVPPGRDPREECRVLARTAEWLLYAEIAAGPNKGCAAYAFEILGAIGIPPDRLAAIYASDPDRYGPDSKERWQNLGYLPAT